MLELEELCKPWKRRKYIYRVRMIDGSEEIRTARYPQKKGTEYNDGSICL